jgi:hypothetical protein
MKSAFPPLPRTHSRGLSHDLTQPNVCSLISGNWHPASRRVQLIIEAGAECQIWLNRLARSSAQLVRPPSWDSFRLDPLQYEWIARNGKWHRDSRERRLLFPDINSYSRSEGAPLQRLVGKHQRDRYTVNSVHSGCIDSRRQVPSAAE